MEEAEFSIPHSIDELLEFADNQYYVQDVTEYVDIKEQYTGLRLTLSSDLNEFIFGKFDFLYSCIKNFKSLSPKITHEVWELVLKAFGLQVSNLRPYLEKGNIDNGLREKLLRNTKMVFYLCTELMYKFEEKFMSEKETTQKPAKGKKKAAEKGAWDWDDEKAAAIHELYKLVNLQLKNLWKKSNISDDFLDQMSRICLKLLEDREIGFASKSSMRNSIFQILSVLCKEYIFGLSLIPRLLQLLMLHEHLAAPLASSISNLEESEGNTGLLHLILSEVESDSEITPKAGSNFAAFIVCLSTENPASLANHIDLLSDIVETEPYTLRTGILEAIKNLILSVYAGDDLSEKKMSERDDLYEILENHLMDVNAFCRCKAIQAWTTFCTSEMLSVKMLLQVLEKIVEHTVDKSSYCRKDAIKFMKACLEHNPFSGNLDKARIEKQLETARNKLKNYESSAGVATFDEEDLYESIERQLQVIVSSALAKELAIARKAAEEKKESSNKKTDEENQDDEEEQEMEVEENQEQEKEVQTEPEQSKEEKETLLKEGIIKIGSLLAEKKLEEAVAMAFDVTKKYDVNNAFGLAGEEEDDDPDEDEDDRDATEMLRKTDYMCTLMKAALQAFKPDNNGPELQEGVKAEIKRQKDIIKFLKNCLFFSEQIHLASDNVLKILITSQTTDLVDAIDFIASAQQFGLLSEADSILKLLEFMHSKDMNLKKAVTDACKKIYLSSIDPTLNAQITHDDYVEAMKKVCNLVHNAHANFDKSVALLIQNWVSEGHINEECFYSLWELVESRTKNECVPALHLLSIALVNKSEIVQSHIATLDRIGFGSRGEGCFELPRWSAQVLALASPKVTVDMLNNPFRISIDDEMYAHMTNLLIKGLFKKSDKEYCDMSSSLITAIFKTCKRPISLVGEILKKMNEEVAKFNPADLSGEEMETPLESMEVRPLTQIGTQNPETQLPESQAETLKTPTQDKFSQVVLLRFVHVIGQVADDMHTFLYEDIMSEIRRQKNLLDLEKDRRRKARHSRARGSMSTTMNDDEEDGALFDVQKLLRGSSKYFVCNTEEENLDSLLRLCDQEVLGENNILGALLPFVQECFTSRYSSHHGLRVTAIQAYGKYLKLSPNFCTKHVRKFVTILTKSKDIRVKIACIHTLADLLKKYPNQCEPYSPYLYECLKDSDILVRFESLVAISKLILSDMIRVKFQISSLAHSLTDDEKNCRDIAKYFFATLATKGNILYNLVLDMISQLSAEYSESNQTQFETIMKVILPHIDKEKQVIALVEKLCSRFKDKAEEIECYNLALCICHLPISSKSIKAVQDALEFYGDKLKYPTVKAQFDELVANSRKQLKTEGKEAFDKWQESLDNCAKGKEAVKQVLADVVASNEEEQANKKEKRKAKRKPAPKKKGSDSEEDFDFEQTPRKQRGRKKKNDSDDEDEVIQTAVRNKRQPPRKLASRNEAIQEEDEDEEEEIESPVKQRRGRKKAVVDSDEELFSTPAKGKKNAEAEPKRRSTRSSIRL